MGDTGTPPAFWAPAVLGALLAALGYLGKLITDFIREWLSTSRKRQSCLAELLALLRAGDVTFLVQSDIRDRLADLISMNAARSFGRSRWDSIACSRWHIQIWRPRNFDCILWCEPIPSTP